jgi:hypothetical protein
MKLINESIYWHRTDRISTYLNRHEVLGFTPAIILTIFFPLLEKLPPKLFHISEQNESRHSKLI